jgi:hypothetical protein
MEQRRAAPPVDVAYYGRETRSSLGWLVLSLFLGGSGLAVYLTTPGAPVANLFMALILGVPTFVLSMLDLGKARALILNSETRRLRYLEGFFARRTVREFSYDEVREVQLIQKQIPSGGGSRGAGSMGWLEIHIVLSGQREIFLEETSTDRASRCVRHLAAALGVPALVNGKPLTVSMGAVPHTGSRSTLSILSRVLLCILAAVIFTLVIVDLWLRYLKH